MAWYKGCCGCEPATVQCGLCAANLHDGHQWRISLAGWTDGNVSPCSEGCANQYEGDFFFDSSDLTIVEESCRYQFSAPVCSGGTNGFLQLWFEESSNEIIFHLRIRNAESHFWRLVVDDPYDCRAIDNLELTDRSGSAPGNGMFFCRSRDFFDNSSTVTCHLTYIAP